MGYSVSMKRSKPADGSGAERPLPVSGIEEQPLGVELGQRIHYGACLIAL